MLVIISALNEYIVTVSYETTRVGDIGQRFDAGS